MHVIIVGCGRVGSTLALELSESGHDVVVIDRNANAFRRLGDNFKGRTLKGIGFDRSLHADVGLHRFRASVVTAALTKAAFLQRSCAKFALVYS